MVAIWKLAKDLWFGRLSRKHASAAIVGIVFVTGFLMLVTIESFGGTAFVSFVGLGLYCAAINLQWGRITGFSIFGNSVDLTKVEEATHDAQEVTSEARKLIDSLTQSRKDLFRSALSATFINANEGPESIQSKVAVQAIKTIESIERAGVFEELFNDVFHSAMRAIGETVRRLEKENHPHASSIREARRRDKLKEYCEEVLYEKDEANLMQHPRNSVLVHLMKLDDYRRRAQELKDQRSLQLKSQQGFVDDQQR